MALARTRLADIQYIAATTPASIYTNPSTTKTYIRGLVIHNTNTTTETVRLYNVPDSGGSLGTAATSNKFYEQGVVANETVIVDFPASGLVLLDTNDSIQAATTTGSKVTVMILGDKE